MATFKESRSRDFNPAEFVINLDALSDAKEGELLDALDAIFQKISDPKVRPADEPNAISGAVLVVCRLREIRNSALGSTHNATRFDKSNWGYSEDWQISVG